MKPLRRIVGTKIYIPLGTFVITSDSSGYLVEVLECGHEQPRNQGLLGPRKATKRRCIHCPDI